MIDRYSRNIGRSLHRLRVYSLTVFRAAVFSSSIKRERHHLEGGLIDDEEYLSRRNRVVMTSNTITTNVRCMSSTPPSIGPIGASAVLGIYFCLFLVLSLPKTSLFSNLLLLFCCYCVLDDYSIRVHSLAREIVIPSKCRGSAKYPTNKSCTSPQHQQRQLGLQKQSQEEFIHGKQVIIIYISRFLFPFSITNCYC